jgi:hypothetical protein
MGTQNDGWARRRQSCWFLRAPPSALLPTNPMSQNRLACPELVEGWGTRFSGKSDLGPPATRFGDESDLGHPPYLPGPIGMFS